MYYPIGHYHVYYGTTLIDYELTYSQRKTLAIHVYPDSSIVVDAPMDTPIEMVAEKVKKRGAWIVRQLRDLESAPLPSYIKRYVSGESYRYLGRQYQLRVVDHASPSVQLGTGYLYVYVQDKTHRDSVKALVDNWYQTQAEFIFKERLALCFPRVQSLGVKYPDLAVRDMRLRWGSCSPTGLISLNSKLIQVPTDLIDYVLFHELCHLKELNHSPAFYALLERVLPTWYTLRHQLNEFEFG